MADTRCATSNLLLQTYLCPLPFALCPSHVLFDSLRHQLDGPRRFSCAEHRHDVRERHGREFAADEVANLERRQVLAEQDAELRVHFLRQAGGTRGATASPATASAPSRR